MDIATAATSAPPASIGSPAPLTGSAVTGRNRPAPPQEPTWKRTQGGLFIVLGALGVSLLGLAPLALGAIRRDAATLQTPAVTVQVAAEGMRFVPAEISVPAGASVRVDFVNRDPTSPHDFQTTRQYRDSRVVLWPNEQRNTVFIATDKPGRYAFICSVRGHAEAGMTGTIVVE